MRWSIIGGDVNLMDGGGKKYCSWHHGAEEREIGGSVAANIEYAIESTLSVF